MTDRYDELRAAAEAATGGTWRAWKPRSRSPEIYTDAPPPNTPNPMIAGQVLRKRDAEYIVLANPETIKALISERDSLLAALNLPSVDDLVGLPVPVSGPPYTRPITAEMAAVILDFIAGFQTVLPALTTKEG